MSKPAHRLAALFVSAAVVFTSGSARAADALPDGYTRVEYVKGDGTAWIDLKTKLTLADKVVAKARIPATPTVGIVYGSRTSNSAQDCFIWGMDAAKTPAMSMDIVNTTAATGGRLSVSSYAALCGHLLVATNCAAYRRIIDLDSGTEYKNETVMTQDFTSPFDIRLFWASGTVWASATQCFVGEIHSLTIIRDDVPRMDLVPCIDPNGVVGFYDLVGKDFYQKDATATGAFTPGPRTNQDGELEYLISADAGAEGTISINGGTPAAKVSAWVKAGEDAEVVFTPSVAGTYRLFNGTPASARMVEGNRVVFAADNPYSLTLSPYDHEDEFFVYTGNEVIPGVVGARTVYTFTNTRSVDLVAKKDMTLEEGLVVAGGGGGGSSGGGGGGLVHITDRHVISAGSILSVTVGAGGKLVAWLSGINGDDSAYSDPTVSVVVKGGGAGWNRPGNNISKDGGSGGGSGGKGVEGQGHDGALSTGAGGGADQPGQETGIGGNGLWLDITGEWHCYASGGGATGKQGGADSGGRGKTDGIYYSGVDGLGGGGGSLGGTGMSSMPSNGRGGNGTVILAVREGDTRSRIFEVEPIDDCLPKDGLVTPKPVVRFGGTLLTENEDYTVTCAHNDTPGCTGWAIITGLGEYDDIVTRVPFLYKDVRLVKIDGSSEASGTSWDDAMDLPTALAGIAAGGAYDIWVAAGTYELTEPISLTTSLKATIKGGFAADDPSNPAKKVAGAKTVIDGADTLNTLLSVDYKPAVAIDQITLIDFAFTRSHSVALTKAGACVFNLQNCVFSNNSHSAIALSAGTLNMTGCMLTRNQKTTANESGNMVSASAGSLNMTDCVIERNGVPFDALPTDSYTTANYLFKSSGDAPFNFKRCRFAANRIHATASGASMFAQPVTWNSCAGMSFTDCAFVGNTLRNNGGNNGSFTCGLVYMPQNGTSKHCPFVNCTFAYNLFDVSGGALLTAASTYSATSTLTVKNCIFWGNRTTTRHKGPLCILNASTYSAHLALSYTFFETGGASDYTSNTAIEGGEGVMVEDPGFVSGSIDDLLGGDGTAGNLYFAADKEDEVAALDVHLHSPEGYRKNGDETWYTDAESASAAIDAGDPTMEVGDEPTPNGSIINLGAYGGTAEASKTPVTAPAATVTSVTWPNEYTQPSIRVTMGGTGAYNAKVTISVSTNGTDWVFVSDEFANVKNGDVIDWLSSGYAPVEGSFKVKVDVVAPGADPFSLTSGNYDVPSGKIIPPWAGKGGDPAKVIHVRAGATGAKNGTSWTTAYDNLEDALVALGNVATKKEVWIAGNPEIGAECDTTTWSISAPVVVRGGFAATENSPEERSPGACSTLDGADLRKGITLSTLESATLWFERLVFTRFTTAALKRSSGSTALVVSNCVFTANPASAVVIAAGATTIAKTTFKGNVKTAANESGCMVSASAGSLNMTDCVIERNGVPFDALPTDSYTTANYLFKSSGDAPFNFKRCRFAANRIHATASGASMFAQPVTWNSCAGMSFTDCAFVGNTLRNNGGNNNSYDCGLVYMPQNGASKHCPFVNCTFAYNLFDVSGGALLMAASTYKAAILTVKNCIFWGNRTTTRHKGPLCIRNASTYSAQLAISYTLFETGGESDYTSTTDIEGMDGVIVANPSFVSGSIDSLLGGDGTPGNLYFAADKADEVAALNVHLLGSAGYTDETTGKKVAGKGKTSPCVDKGDPASDYSQEPKPNGKRINMGCYGGTPWATRSPGGGALFIR